jgi:2-polyprenyl-6-hydroxyphenyl methylase/3-demethylubiquinone-9 3-methyltransferase
MTKSTVDNHEMIKFAKLAADWWDKEGPLKTLHDINPIRLDFINHHTNLMGKKVLDVGCGGGILCESMVERGSIVTGIDAEHAAITSAKNHACNLTNPTYVCTTVETFDANMFDIITCMEMLEHVYEPEHIIASCAQRLNGGGFLFLSTINRNISAYISAIIGAEYLLGILPKQTHDYQKFIKPSELASMVRAANLHVIGLQGMAYNPFSRVASFQKSVQVNYLMACFKP